MPTEEELQRQQDALKDQLKAQIDRSLVTNVEYHFEELDNGDGTKKIKNDGWAMTIRGLWQDRPTPKDSA